MKNLKSNGSLTVLFLFAFIASTIKTEAQKTKYEELYTLVYSPPKSVHRITEEGYVNLILKDYKTTDLIFDPPQEYIWDYMATYNKHIDYMRIKKLSDGRVITIFLDRTENEFNVLVYYMKNDSLLKKDEKICKCKVNSHSNVSQIIDEEKFIQKTHSPDRIDCEKKVYEIIELMKFSQNKTKL